MILNTLNGNLPPCVVVLVAATVCFAKFSTDHCAPTAYALAHSSEKKRVSTWTVTTDKLARLRQAFPVHGVSTRVVDANKTLLPQGLPDIAATKSSRL